MSVTVIKRYFTYSLGTLTRHCSTQTIKPIPEVPKSKGTTVDSNDVKQHGELREKWWDLDGPMRALHSLNPLRVQLVRDGLVNVGWREVNPGHPLEGVKILDVGCGGGILSEPLARIGASVTGLDMSKTLIELAKTHATLDPSLSGRLTYLNTSIEDYIRTNAGMYDAVVASEILEHVSDQELFLQCCAESVKPGGSIFITTMNKTIPSYLGGIVAAEYILKLLPVGTHDWKKFISPEEVQRILEKSGCRTKLIHGELYNPINNQWTWISSTAINYALHAIKTEEIKK
ncbi:ubiquinone biosynthesis O-methyltransferase, mitochondrial [Diachasma alloeum]|uniref:ubiquinone biosynthesis O-methyltransferase, mitochondrial n=1 Tax=Diachasma alloeum TaxID=454923 RepID=UPI0007383EBB|nr:ubiquinone biosynthesis O-methyltransferase, mitochondrial [Diachasma alloeum]XP_015111064.1 ubiquinone biosynthesis O-methyltransferase, mitochondrial [Diachasma alloeum]